MLPVHQLLSLGALLFCTGLAITIIKRNAIMVLLGLELMLNAANINLVAFNQHKTGTPEGQMFALFVIVVAVSEVAVGLAIVLRVYRYFQTSVPDEIRELKD